MGVLEADRELVLMLEDSVSAFLADRHDRRRIGRPAKAGGDLWPQMAELGLLGLVLPEADGGAGLSAAAAVSIGRLLGEHLVPEPFIANAVLPSVIVAALPEGPQRSAMADLILGGEQRLALAWQERAGQIGAWPAGTRYDAAAGLTGSKLNVAAPGSSLLVTAQMDGVPVVLLAGASQGTTEVSDTLDGSTTASVTFDKTPMDGPPLLSGDHALLAVNQALNLATLTLSAQLCGLMRAALDLTLEHLRTRTQFGQAIGSFQALQHRAVDLHIQHALAEAAVREAAHLYDAAADSPRTAAAISAAKARASAGALLICKEAVQMHGAIGFTLESDVGLFLRAALRWSSWLGEAGAHRRRFVMLKGDDDA